MLKTSPIYKITRGAVDVNIFKQLLGDFRGMRHYIIASALVFLAGMYLGFSSDQFHAFLYDQIKGISDIANKLHESEHPQLLFFIFIFLNNAIKSIFFIFLGAFLGVIPLFILLVNGMILGYVLADASDSGGSVFVLFMKGILPHGIIELPAIIIACAYGIRFGILLLQGLFSLVRPSIRESKGQEIVRFLRMTLPLMIVLAGSLCIAAIIESTLTYMLMSRA